MPNPNDPDGDAWDNVSDRTPHPFAPLGEIGDGDALTFEIVDGPWSPARYSEHSEIDMIIETSNGRRYVLAPGKTLAVRMRDHRPRPKAGDKLRIEQAGEGFEKDWTVEVL